MSISAAPGTTVQFAKENPNIYYPVGFGYFLLSPVVGIARIALGMYKYSQLPSIERFNAFKERISNQPLKEAANDRGPEKMKDFWRGQIVRGLLELILPIIAGVAYLLRDLVYVRPESYSNFTNCKNYYKEKFEFNIAGYDEVKEALWWHKAMGNAIAQDDLAIAREKAQSTNAETAKAESNESGARH